MCDERFAVEGLVSGQNQYESHVPDGCICAGDLGVQHIERLCVPGELCGRFLGILPINLLAYDQSVGWVEYGRTFPVSKKTLVAEKYLIGLFCAAAAVVIGGLFVTVIPLRTGTAPDKDVLSLLAGSVCAILLINGISLPLLYRFGAEKASMIYILTFVGLGALLGGGGAVMDELQQNGPGSGPLPVPLWLAAVLLLAVLALYAVSWRVSVAWYGKYKK